MKNRALLLCAMALPGLAAAADGDQWYIASTVPTVDSGYEARSPFSRRLMVFTEIIPPPRSLANRVR